MPIQVETEFSPERLQVINDIERQHFWFKGRRSLVNYLLHRFVGRKRDTLIDVGCGTGFNLQFWEQFADRIVGLDRLLGSATHQPEGSIALVVADLCDLPVASGSQDIAVLLDVLEHVPDQQVLAEVRESLADTGIIVITVPAIPWLWSGRDVAAGHLRRYTRQSLNLLLDQAGFEILYLNYYQCLLLPVVAISRFLGRSNSRMSAVEETPGRWLNRILGWITRLELTATRHGLTWPWGSSLVAVARKS